MRRRARRYRCEPVDRWTPDALFDRAFAFATLAQARSLLEADCRRRGHERVFAVLSPILTGANESTYAESAAVGSRKGSLNYLLPLNEERARERVRRPKLAAALQMADLGRKKAPK